MQGHKATQQSFLVKGQQAQQQPAHQPKAKQVFDVSIVS